MLKQTISYTDFDDKPQVEDLYFNLTKTELMDNLHLTSRFESVQKMLDGGEKRELSEIEIKEILDLVKLIMQLSYGVRSADGRRFAKSEDIWTEFTQTMAYDTYLLSLFQDPNRAISFIVGIMPSDLRDQAQAEMRKRGAETPFLETVNSDVPVAPVNTTKNPMEMSREELLEAMREATQKNAD